MGKAIENPKVFISYAWSSEEYQNLVLSFAEKLVNDGIDVIIDKWCLKEGNDTFAFMEKSVNDETITNVLILLDPVYAEKADNHKGGVGTETQIISPNVYNEVNQDKFIPIIMQRTEDGTVVKPAYLQGRLHFDLSNSEKYDIEYYRLVKTLYGKEVYEKPTLGKKPSWVDKPLEISHKTIVMYDSIKKNISDKVRIKEFTQYLNDISNQLIEYASGKEYCHDLSEYIPLYDETSEIRNNYLLLLKYSSYISEEAKIISEFFETTLNSVNQINTTKSQIVIIRIHELFIYTIAFFINNHQYNSVGYILGKTYFSNSKVYNADGVDSFKMFYSAINHTDLDRAICKRDDKNYHSGTAHYWMETIATECCTKEQFVLADLICFNYSIYGNYIRDHWYWFPITYAYDSHFYSCLSFIGKKLVSQEFVLEILPLFGYDSFDAFVTEYKKQEELIQTGSLTNYKYSGGFERPYLLRDFTKPENVGKYR